MQVTSSSRNYLQHLPFEIVVQITQLLSKKDAYRCMFVCRSWYYAALPVFYKSIFIDHNKFNTLGHSVINKAMDGYRHANINRHGHLIKTIRIEDYGTADFESSYFLLLLLVHAPNVETLNLSLCRNLEFHLAALTHPNHIHYAPYLKRIQVYFEYKFDSIYEYNPGFREYNLDYLECCYNLRATIRHLEIHDLQSKIHLIEGPMTPLEYLSHFPHLTHLTVSVNRDQMLVRNQNTAPDQVTIIDTVLKLHKNLESLQLLYFDGRQLDIRNPDTVRNRRFIDNHVPNTSTRRYIMHWQRNLELRQREQALFTQQVEAEMSEVLKMEKELESTVIAKKPPTQVYLALKELTYASPILSKNEIEYIISNISPKQLRCLTIEVNRLCALEWYHQIGFNNVFTFAFYLSQASNLQLKFVDNHHFRIVPPLVHYESLPLLEVWTQRLLWKFIHTIRGSRNLKYNLSLNIIPPYFETKPTTKVIVNSMEKTIYLSEVIFLDNFICFDQFVSSDPTRQNWTLNFPADPFFSHIARETKYLSLNIPSCLPFEAALSLLKTFHDLDKFDIQSADVSAIQCGETDTVKLTRARLTRIQFTPNFSKALNHFLSSLKTLSLVDCAYLSEEGWISKRPVLDLRGLINLKRLSLTIQTATSSYNKVFVHVHYYLENSRKPHCIKVFKLMLMKSIPKDPQMKSLEEINDPHAMKLTIKVCDRLKQISFLKSHYHPQDAILN